MTNTTTTSSSSSSVVPETTTRIGTSSVSGTSIRRIIPNTITTTYRRNRRLIMIERSIYQYNLSGISSFAQSIAVVCLLIITIHSSNILVQCQTTIANIGSSNFEVGGFVDSSTCWVHLNDADTSPQDGYVDRTEYITFARSESSPTIIGYDITDFKDLPPAYQLAFVAASCLCNNPDFGGNATDKECCLGDNGKIIVPPNPVTSGNTTNDTGEAAYLYATCVLTSAASETVLTSPAPSIIPSGKPSISLEPSIVPSSTPIIVTSVPTTAPQVQPVTKKPVSKPTSVPATTAPVTVPLVASNATVTYDIAITNGKILLQDSSFETEYLSNLQVGLNRLAQSVVDTITKKSSNRKRQLRFTQRQEQTVTATTTSSSNDNNSIIQLELPTILQDVTTNECPNGGGPLVSNVGEKDAISVNTTMDVCQKVTAIVQLLTPAPSSSTATTKASSTSSSSNITEQFQTDLYNAIYDGEYQIQLDNIYQQLGELASPIKVLTGYIPQTPTTPTSPSSAGGTPSATPAGIDTSSNDSLSPGSITGIVLGASAFVILPIIFFLTSRMKRDGDDEYDDDTTNFNKPPDYQEYQPDTNMNDLGTGGSSTGAKFQLPPGDGSSLAGNSQQTDLAVKSVGSGGGAGRGAIAVGAGVTAGAAAAAAWKGGQGSKKVMEAMMLVGESDDMLAEPGANTTSHSLTGSATGVTGVGLLLANNNKGNNKSGNNNDDASSNAGSSGWSSSAGISSLNTGSIDDSSDIAAAAGATLAGIGLASATFRQQQQQQQTRAAATSPTAVGGVSGMTTSDDTSTSDDDDDDDDEDEVARNVTDQTGAFGSQGSEPDIGVVSSTDVTRDHLDALIESGDWAAVGATAALLAAASDSQSATTRNTGASKSIGSRGSSVDAARAAELDHLVDAGDWEGVVKAAAKFEAATATTTTATGATGAAVVEGFSLGVGTAALAAAAGAAAAAAATGGSSSKGSRSRTNSSADSSADSGTGSGTGTFTGTFDPTISTSVSDDPSRAAKLAEYRAEVEALVRRVVPEEIDNVDEMMNQFKGREEELIETLRTMQERAVAQKARQAGQKNAKLEARRTVQRGVVPGASAVAQRVATFETKTADVATTGSSTTTGPPVAPPASITQQTTPAVAVVSSTPVAPAVAPTVAQGTGVGAAAIGAAAVVGATTAAVAGMAVIGPTTLPSGPRQQPDGSPRGSLAGSTESMRRTRSALDAAIEAGDWEAVRDTAAALSVSSAATSVGSSEVERLANANVSTTSSEGTGASRRRQLLGVNADRASELDTVIDRGDWEAVVAIANRFSEEDKKPIPSGSTVSKMSKEEEDALREAELWMKIAEQKKAEGATDAGASEAAEWAIQRSLSQLREAEKRSQQSQQQKDKYHTEGEDEV